MKYNYDELIQRIPEKVGELAFSLHNGDRSSLSIPLDLQDECASKIENSDLWTIQEGGLQFASIEARNLCTAVQAYRSLAKDPKEISPSALFDVALQIWVKEIRNEDLAVGHLFAIAAKRINILQVAAVLIGSDEKSVFDVLHCVEAALRYLPEIIPEDLCSLISAQYPKTENDLARGVIFNKIEDMLLEKTELARNLYQYVCNHPTETTTSLYCSALLSLAKAGELKWVTEKLLSDIKTDNQTILCSAIWTISHLLSIYNLPESEKLSFIDVLRTNYCHDVTQIKKISLRAISLAAKKHQELVIDLLFAAESHDQDALYVLASHLFLNLNSLRAYSELPSMILALTYVAPEMRGTVECLDGIFSELLNDRDGTELVLRFLRAWLVQNAHVDWGQTKEGIEYFEQTISALSQSSEHLERLITEWLLAEEIVLAKNCSNLIRFLNVRKFKQIHFSKNILDDLDEADLILLVRRMLGYVFFEESLLALTFSLLNTENAPERTYCLIHLLLTGYIGKNYPDYTLDEIKKKAEFASPELKNMLDSAQENITSYRSAIERLPRVQELRPPFQLRRAIELRNSRERRKSTEAAEEKSIFRQLATTISIKAGVGHFSTHAGKIGEINHFHSLSHSMYLPRHHVNDPLGYEIRGFFFRIAQKEEK